MADKKDIQQVTPGDEDIEKLDIPEPIEPLEEVEEEEQKNFATVEDLEALRQTVNSAIDIINRTKIPKTVADLKNDRGYTTACYVDHKIKEAMASTNTIERARTDRGRAAVAPVLTGDTFDEDGYYNTTMWMTNDVISSERLNKIEDALTVNTQMLVDKTTIPTRVSQLDNDKKFTTEDQMREEITRALVSKAEPGTLSTSMLNGTTISQSERFILPYDFQTQNYGAAKLFLTDTVGESSTEYTFDVKYVGTGSVNLGLLSKGIHTISMYIIDALGKMTNIVSVQIICGALGLTTTFDHSQMFNTYSNISIPYIIDSLDPAAIMVNLITIDGTEYRANCYHGYNSYVFPSDKMTVGIHRVSMIIKHDTYSSNIIEFDVIILDNTTVLLSMESSSHELEHGYDFRTNYQLSTFIASEFKINCYVNNEFYKEYKANLGQNTIIIPYDFFQPNQEYNFRLVATDVTNTYSSEITFKVNVKPNSFERILHKSAGLQAKFLMNKKTNHDEVLDKIYSEVTNDEGITPYIQLHDYNFTTNGWVDGKLKSNSNAWAELVNYLPFKDNVTNGFTFEILFKSYNIGDDNNRVIDCVGTEVPYGLYIDSDKMNIKTGANEINANFSDRERVKLSFVVHRNSTYLEEFIMDENGHSVPNPNPTRKPNPMIQIYIDGVLTEVAMLSDNGTGSNKIYESIQHNNPLLINTDKSHTLFGVNEIESIFIYNRALEHEDVLNNYIADFNNLLDQKDLYDKNYTTIDQNIPSVYFFDIEGLGYESVMTKDTKQYMRMTYNSPDESRFGPSMDCIAQMSWQGTSSLAYPTKNYKIKLYDYEKDPITGDPVNITDKNSFTKKKVNMFPSSDTGYEEQVFTFKADYMDSAHFRNTGLARLVTDIVFDGVPNPAKVADPKTRNSINGWPCQIYINGKWKGIFNWDHDKACSKTLGMETIPNTIRWEIKANTDTSAGAFVKTWTDKESCYEAILSDFEIVYDEDAFEKNTGDYNLTKYYDELGFDYEGMAVFGGYQDLAILILARAIQFVSETNDKDIWNANINKYINITQASRYYLHTMTSMMIDNFAKNCILVFYGDDSPGYFSFYDLDSSLGLDNTGYKKFECSIETSDPGVYNCATSRMWIKLADFNKTELFNEFKTMREGKYTYENFCKWLIDDQIDHIPIILYNRDCYQKYISQGRQYLHMVHGNSKAFIKKLLYDRFQYVDSLFLQHNSPYTKQNVTIRSCKPLDAESIYDGNGNIISQYTARFDIQTYSPQYVTIKWRNGLHETKKVNKGETVRFEYNMINSQDNEIILYCASNLKQIGDCSGLNPTSVDIGNATRLIDFVCENSDKLIKADLSKNKYLRHASFKGCSVLGTASGGANILDVSGCENLKSLDVRGTQITQVLTNPDGSSLEEILLSEATQTVSMVNQTYLKTLGIPYGHFNNMGLEWRKGRNNIVANISRYMVKEPLYVHWDTNKIPVDSLDCQCRYAINDPITIVSEKVSKVSNHGRIQLPTLSINDIADYLAINLFSIDVSNIDLTKDIYITNSPDITKCKNLITLNLINCPNIEYIQYPYEENQDILFEHLSSVQNLTIDNSLNFDSINVSQFKDVKNLTLRNLKTLEHLSFDNMLVNNDVSKIESMTFSNLPLVEEVTMNVSPKYIGFYQSSEYRVSSDSYTYQIGDTFIFKILKNSGLPDNVPIKISAVTNGGQTTGTLLNVTIPRSTLENGWTFTIPEITNSGSHASRIRVWIFSTLDLKNTCVMTHKNNQNILVSSNKIEFPENTTLDLSGLNALTTIRSNYGIKGLDRIILPLSCKHLLFNKLFGGNNEINTLISSTSEHVNDPSYKGIDFKDMVVNSVSLGYLKNIVYAENFNVSPTTNRFEMNANRSSFEFFHPVSGTLDFTNYTHSYFTGMFRGIDFVNDLVNIVINKDLTQVTDANYCFYYCKFDENSYKIINKIFSRLTNCKSLAYCFSYSNIVDPRPIVLPPKVENINQMFLNCKDLLYDIELPNETVKDFGEIYANCTKLKYITSQWNKKYPMLNAYSKKEIYSSNSITHIDGIESPTEVNGIPQCARDLIPIAWGGYEFRDDNTIVMEITTTERNVTVELTGEKIDPNIKRVYINWGDGQIKSSGQFVDAYRINTYKNPGTYIVKSHIMPGAQSSFTQAITKVLRIPQKEMDLYEAFHSAKNLIEIDFAGCTPTNIAGCFISCSKLENIRNLNITSKITSLVSLFLGCTSLQTVEGIENWNTSNVKNMANCFNTSNFLNYDFLQSWDFSNVTNLVNCFNNCQANNLNVSNMVMNKAIDLSGMFKNCSATEIIGFDTWDTSNVKDISSLFHKSKLSNYDFILDWDLSNCTNMRYLFAGIKDITFNVTGLVTDKVTNIEGMFQETKPIEIIGMDTWDMSNIQNLKNMFSGTNYQGVITFKNIIFNESSISANQMFYGANIGTVDFTNTNLIHCGFGNAGYRAAIKKIILTNAIFTRSNLDGFLAYISTSPVFEVKTLNPAMTNLNGLFKNYKIESDFEFHENVIDARNCFENCTSLKYITNNWNTKEEIEYESTLSNGWNSTDFIDVYNYNGIKIEYSLSRVNLTYYTFYDINKNQIGNNCYAADYYGTGMCDFVKFGLPANCRYIKFNASINNFNNTRIYGLTNELKDSSVKLAAISNIVTKPTTITIADKLIKYGVYAENLDDLSFIITQNGVSKTYNLTKFKRLSDDNDGTIIDITDTNIVNKVEYCYYATEDWITVEPDIPMTITANWNSSYSHKLLSCNLLATNCYSGCTNIETIDGKPSDIGYIPKIWGGYEFTSTNSNEYVFNIPQDNLTLTITTDPSMYKIGDGAVDWGDGIYTRGEHTHTYSKAGTYTVRSKYSVGGLVVSSNNTNLIEVKRIVRRSEPGYYSRMFTNCSNLVKVNINGIMIQSATHMFRNCSSLTTIEGIPDLSQCTSLNSCFSACVSISDFSFLENWDFSNIKDMDSFTTNPNISVQTMLYIFNSLPVVENRIITLGSTNIEKLTDEQIAIVTMKGWTLN